MSRRPIESKKGVGSREFRVQKMASYLHRTATTVYPCCVPTLGDSTGAGRVGLADAKIRRFKGLDKQFDGQLLVRTFATNP